MIYISAFSTASQEIVRVSFAPHDAFTFFGAYGDSYGIVPLFPGWIGSAGQDINVTIERNANRAIAIYLKGLFINIILRIKAG